MNMRSKYRNLQRHLWTGLLVGVLGASLALADERRFTYTYEPETQPKGVAEFEQWITLRTQRTQRVGQENFNKWRLREEFEYGVTDRYSLALYLNTSAESFRDPATARDEAEFEFEGISLENRYLVLNPAEHAVGLTLYLEPSFSGSEAELEQKIIIGQRHGDWKWALNLTHATEWEDNFHETEGELEFTLGLARDLGPNWSVGLEVRNHNELPEYEEWEHTALFVGPAINYRRDKWWATLTVLPQVFGKNFNGDPDGHSRLVLDEHERLEVRLIFGIHL